MPPSVAGDDMILVQRIDPHVVEVAVGAAEILLKLRPPSVAHDQAAAAL